MDKANWMQRAGITPVKLLLVAILAIVLLVVIVVQFGGSNSETDPSPRAENEPATEAAPRTPPKPKRPSAKQVAHQKPTRADEQPWPQIPLDEILTHDPLATPPWLVPAKTDTPQDAKPSKSEQDAQRERQLAWERLHGQGVGLVLITSDGPVATIGDRQIRVGDVIDGFRVEKIDSRGLILADPN